MKIKSEIEVTGIVRAMDDLGRIVIPKEFRRSLDIEPGDAIEMLCIDGRVVIEKVK